ncbi:T-cell activation Rho GTPase-activating protein-like [Harpia harpyja]|uniref:T-cell activation Rho GTPase-activating protein-like n=1 Tax=Harpia harpyja TaxID=202280 RepID=UPI0022B16E0E|nr:T-cell activation Rho GTPase-activating protein-like [Harpia harpyja]
MGLPWPFALRRTPAAAQAPGQAGSGCSRALFGQPLAALCGEDGSLPQPIQEMLAVLHQEGPSTEGVFRRAASGTEFRELREALDRGADVDLGSQAALLLAVILKDFLRSIPAKLLVTDLYEDWMAAMQKSGKEEKVEELKAVAEKLPGANLLLLLKRLLALLQHIGHNASSSRMTASNLAICLGPNLLSPPNEDLLPLEAMLAVTEKVRCTEQPAAALPAYASLAAQRSLAASSLEQMLVGWLPARAAPQPQPPAQRQGSGVGKAA